VARGGALHRRQMRQGGRGVPEEEEGRGVQRTHLEKQKDLGTSL
jgi:hypothetical protein